MVSNEIFSCLLYSIRNSCKPLKIFSEDNNIQIMNTSEEFIIEADDYSAVEGFTGTTPNYLRRFLLNYLDISWRSS